MQQFNMNFLHKYSLTILFLTVIANGIKTDDIRNHLGTRTPYRFKYNKDDSKIKYGNCKEQKIWMLIRHGSRLPSAKDIVGAQTTLQDLKYEVLLQHNSGKGHLNSEQLKKLQHWTSDMPVEQEKYLTLEGQDEMILLAERIQKKFPSIVKQKYDNSTFQFRYTATQRTQQSARFFSLGLFDKKNAENVVFEPALKVDTTLRFYKHCERWQKQVKKNPHSYKEQRLYGISREMNETLEYVSKYLGLDRLLSLDTVTLMYRICGFETAWHKHSMSPWCYPFNNEGIKRMEYFYDLKHYWVDGYGNELTHRPACLLMKHMFHSISNKGRNATFLFAHSGTLLKILTYLQLYKPESHLRGDTIDHKRTWRASNIDCFASNLAFVLYKCKDGEKVLTLHQEKVIKLPLCENELCPVKTLKKFYENSLQNCNFSDMCNVT
ncbi:multiple inositol polyphosphate phosphatase 1-like [Zerene cesonia]|uniref:multiple inositol polyphosphate phosphatase 1-like n=1 Tax=Zerene cesonia TaxID=33412 RepID=UPI0018E53426|nr:multiple inositol polyphosphate phosphatase 1-like [Zerene cesonia]